MEIAAERGFVESTIFGHLTHFVLNGELEVYDIMPQYEFDEIMNFVQEQNTEILRDLVETSQNKYNYNELRFVIEMMRKQSV